MTDWKNIKKEIKDEFILDAYIHTSGLIVYFMEGVIDSQMINFQISNKATNFSGVAHVLEHLLVRSSIKFGKKNVLRELSGESLNYYFNAVTSRGSSFYQSGTTDVTDFYNLLEIMFLSLFSYVPDNELFKIEAKNIVKNEMDSIYKNYDVRVLSNYLFSTQVDYLKYDQGGLPSELEKITLNDVVGYYLKNYQLKNTRLFLVTSEDKNKVLNKISDLCIESTLCRKKEFLESVKLISRSCALPFVEFSNDVIIFSFIGSYTQQDSMFLFIQKYFIPILNSIIKISYFSLVRIGEGKVAYCRLNSKIDENIYKRLSETLNAFKVSNGLYPLYLKMSSSIDFEVQASSVDTLFERIRNLSDVKDVSVLDLKYLNENYLYDEIDFYNDLRGIEIKKVNLDHFHKIDEEVFMLPDEMLADMQRCYSGIPVHSFQGIDVSCLAHENNFILVDKLGDWSYGSQFFKKKIVVIGKNIQSILDPRVATRLEQNLKMDNAFVKFEDYYPNSSFYVIGYQKEEDFLNELILKVEKELLKSNIFISEDLYRSNIFSTKGLHRGMIYLSMGELRKNRKTNILASQDMIKINLLPIFQLLNCNKLNNVSNRNFNSEPRVFIDLIQRNSIWGNGCHVGICLKKFTVFHIAALDIYSSILSLYYLSNEIRDKLGAYTTGARVIYEHKYFSVTTSNLNNSMLAHKKIIEELLSTKEISIDTFSKAKVLSISSFDYPRDICEAASWIFGLKNNGWKIDEINNYKKIIINLELYNYELLLKDVIDNGDQIRLVVTT